MPKKRKAKATTVIRLGKVCERLIVALLIQLITGRFF